MAQTSGKFVRFAVPKIVDDDSQTAIGVVNLAWDLLDAPETPAERMRELKVELDWIDAHLDVPDRFNRTTSKGWYRRKTRGISWLRSSATDHVAAMRRLADTVAKCGHEVIELVTDRVGYIIYEDDVQVVAEPFRDTRTK